jgi:beta-propeller repeat-containing protein
MRSDRQRGALALAGAVGCLVCSAACEDAPGSGVDEPLGGADGRMGAALASDAGLGEDWQRALGSRGLSVSSSGVAADGDQSALVTGNTDGALDGTNAGSLDAFVAKYSRSGDALWARQLGTSDVDTSAGVSADAAGNVFIAGATSGALDGSAAGFGDAFVAKYSRDGALEWARQLGSSEPDAASAVSVDVDGNVIIAGYSRGTLEGSREGLDADAFVAKYSTGGELIWSRQLGSQPGYDDLAASVSSDAEGNVVIAGHSFGGLEAGSGGSADAFVAKYSPGGELVWLRQRGEANYDSADAVSADASGDVFVAGQIDGFLVGGPGVIIPGAPYVAKYSPEGTLLWERALDEASVGAAASIATDGVGGVFVGGYSTAAVGGPNQGLYDTFVIQLSGEGERLSALGLGVAGNDRATGVTTSAAGDLFISHQASNVGGEGTDQSFLTRRSNPRATSGALP